MVFDDNIESRIKETKRRYKKLTEEHIENREKVKSYKEQMSSLYKDIKKDTGITVSDEEELEKIVADLGSELSATVEQMEDALRKAGKMP